MKNGGVFTVYMHELYSLTDCNKKKIQELLKSSLITLKNKNKKFNGL